MAKTAPTRKWDKRRAKLFRKTLPILQEVWPKAALQSPTAMLEVRGEIAIRSHGGSSRGSGEVNHTDGARAARLTAHSPTVDTPVVNPPTTIVDQAVGLPPRLAPPAAP
jgi:hypothetical protein